VLADFLSRKFFRARIERAFLQIGLRYV